jgi:hypothetical protein
MKKPLNARGASEKEDHRLTTGSNFGGNEQKRSHMFFSQSANYYYSKEIHMFSNRTLLLQQN